MEPTDEAPSAVATTTKPARPAHTDTTAARTTGATAMPLVRNPTSTVITRLSTPMGWTITSGARDSAVMCRPPPATPSRAPTCHRRERSTETSSRALNNRPEPAARTALCSRATAAA
jgi:hypothetical protein